MNLLAETGQHAYAAVPRNGARKVSRLFARNIQPRPLAIAEKVRVVAEALEAQLLSERREVIVIGMRQRVRQIHAHSRQTELGLRLDDLGAQPRQSHRDLNRGARLKTAAGDDSLIHHR